MQRQGPQPEREEGRMKTVVVYYSLNGNTAWAAEKIADLLGAETLALVPERPYPARGAAKFLLGGKSAVFQETPLLRPYDFRAEEVRQVIFGFPVWAGNVAPPIRSFLASEGKDLAGKRLAAFVCQSGAGAEKALGRLEACLPSPLAAKLILIDPKDRPSPENEGRIAAFCEACRG